jgi:hypothetical protein
MYFKTQGTRDSRALFYLFPQVAVPSLPVGTTGWEPLIPLPFVVF